MKRFCPSCGSQIDDNDEICPNCGEPVESEPSAAAPAPSVPSTSRAESRPSAERPGAGGTGAGQASRRASGAVICPACGTTNPAGATECSNCGEDLSAAVPDASPATRPRASKPGSGRRDYMIAILATVVVAVIVFFVAKKDEVTGPAQPAAQAPAEGALPPGHPPADSAALLAAQSKQIDELTKRAAAAPGDMAVKLQLANALYDAKRFTESLPYYQSFVDANPNDVNARTDLAYAIYEVKGPDSAIVQLKKVLAQDPKHQFAAYNMAMMYVAKKDRDSVLVWLDEVIRIDSTSVQAQRAMQLVQALEQAHAPIPSVK